MTLVVRYEYFKGGRIARASQSNIHYHYTGVVYHSPYLLYFIEDLNEEGCVPNCSIQHDEH